MHIKVFGVEQRIRQMGVFGLPEGASRAPVAFPTTVKTRNNLGPNTTPSPALGTKFSTMVAASAAVAGFRSLTQVLTSG